MDIMTHDDFPRRQENFIAALPKRMAGHAAP